jgi:hypothetical protein
MPYQIELLGSQYAVVDDKGKTVGTHPTKGEAEDQVRALYANVPDATKDNVLRYGVRRSGIGDSSSGASISASDSITNVEKQTLEGAAKMENQSVDINKIPGGTPEGNSVTSTYKGCGCETCKAMGVDCPDCPACSPKNVGDGNNAEFVASKEEKSYKTIWSESVFDLTKFIK